MWAQHEGWVWAAAVSLFRVTLWLFFETFRLEIYEFVVLSFGRLNLDFITSLSGLPFMWLSAGPWGVSSLPNYPNHKTLNVTCSFWLCLFLILFYLVAPVFPFHTNFLFKKFLALFFYRSSGVCLCQPAHLPAEIITLPVWWDFLCRSTCLSNVHPVWIQYITSTVFLVYLSPCIPSMCCLSPLLPWLAERGVHLPPTQLFSNLRLPSRLCVTTASNWNNWARPS